MNIDEVIALATDKLRAIALRPHFEAEVLLGYILLKDRVSLHTQGLQPLKKEEEEAFMRVVEQRVKGKPIEYITQKVSFHAFDFFIDQGALIPRPETEILIDKVQDLIKQKGLKQIVEVGVGSGALICTLALLNPSLHFYGSDIATSALEVAYQNIQRYHLQDQVTLAHTSFLDQLPQPFEILYSNPPYIKQSYPLPLPVTFEPADALFAGQDGLEILKELILLSHKRRIPFLACEMGYDQKDEIYTFLKQLGGYHSLEFYHDLAGLDRGFVVEFSISRRS